MVEYRSFKPAVVGSSPTEPFLRDMAQSGSVVALGAICRGFESSYPVILLNKSLLGEIGKHNRFKICP
jgi:hypothetical protein